MGQQLYVNVLNTTGPGMLGEALSSYAGRNLGKVRKIFGETPGDSQSWDRLSVVHPLSTKANIAPVIVLPYCFFRSRGCEHLLQRFEDKVVFHHEFDTSWRPSFWHNYYEPKSTEL